MPRRSENGSSHVKAALAVPDVAPQSDILDYTLTVSLNWRDLSADSRPAKNHCVRRRGSTALVAQYHASSCRIASTRVLRVLWHSYSIACSEPSSSSMFQVVRDARRCGAKRERRVGAVTHFLTSVPVPNGHAHIQLTMTFEDVMLRNPSRGTDGMNPYFGPPTTHNLCVLNGCGQPATLEDRLH